MEICGPSLHPGKPWALLGSTDLEAGGIERYCQPLPGLWMGEQITHSEPQILVELHVGEPLAHKAVLSTWGRESSESSWVPGTACL